MYIYIYICLLFPSNHFSEQSLQWEGITMDAPQRLGCQLWDAGVARFAARFGAIPQAKGLHPRGESGSGSFPGAIWTSLRWIGVAVFSLVNHGEFWFSSSNMAIFGVSPIFITLFSASPISTSSRRRVCVPWASVPVTKRCDARWTWPWRCRWCGSYLLPRRWGRSRRILNPSPQ